MSDYKAEVENLRQEILNLKADKEFVWSLWKRLQLSSPDLTEAVSLISQRERDKMATEHADMQTALKEKDEQLRQKEAIIDARNGEIEALTMRNNEMAVRSAKLERQCADLADKATKLDEMMTSMEQQGTSAPCGRANGAGRSRDGSRDGSEAQRKIVSQYERERHQLSETVSRLQREVTSLVAQRAELQLESVKTKDRLISEDELRACVADLRVELEAANAHIGTQQHTIDLLRDQIERWMARPGQDGYSSDGAVTSLPPDEASYRDNGAGDVEAPVPIVDLNYKVDRLSLHMRQLQDRLASSRAPPSSCNELQRSRSTPPRNNHKLSLQRNQMNRKIEFLTLKLAKTERQLSEERSTATSSTDFLDKANKRLKISQLTIKQLRQQLDDVRGQHNEWRISVNQLETEVNAMRKEIHNREVEKHRMVENSVNDADRIQELLSKMENMRDELTEKRVRQSEESGAEMERLRQLVQQLESEKCAMERASHAEADHSDSPMCPVQHASRHRCAPTRIKKSKINIGNGRDSRLRQTATKNNRKTSNMCAILNHFSGHHNTANGMETGKEDEWEDVDSDEEEEASRTTDITYTEPNSDGRASTSTGTIVARVAAINQCCDKGDSLAVRRTAARRNHITRIQKTKDKSVAETDATIAKRRAASLEQQLKSLISSRDEYRSKCDNLQSQVKTANEELCQAKARCSRLADSIKKLSGQCQLVPGGAVLDCRPHRQVTALDDLDPILQSCRGEVSASVAMYRELQQELARRDSEVAQIKERLSKAERENSLKRRIIDDLKAKMASVDDATDRDKKVLEAKDRRIRELEEGHCKLKTQIESLQTRFNVVLDERRRFEAESATVTARLETAESRLAEMRHAKQSVESRLSRIDECHENQLTDVISRSGSALDKADLQIQTLKMRGSKYEGLVVNLAKDFYRKIREIRRLLEYGQRRFNHLEVSGSGTPHLPSAPAPAVITTSTGYEFARNKAADILMLSPSEIDCLLTGSTAASASARKVQRGQQSNNNSSAMNESAAFPQKCRDAFKDRAFDDVIQALFAEKLEEIADLLVLPSSCSVVADDSGCASSS